MRARDHVGPVPAVEIDLPGVEDATVAEITFDCLLKRTFAT